MSAKPIVAGYLMPHPPVIVPGVGKDSGEAAATTAAMRQVAQAIARHEPDTIVLLSPHAPMFSDYIFLYGGDTLSGSLRQFGSAERLCFPQASIFLAELKRLMDARGIPGGHLDVDTLAAHDLENSLDHGALVPLHFIREAYAHFELVVMSPSAMDLQRVYELGQLIHEAAGNTNKKTIVIASGDMSHKVNAQSPYGECPEGAAFDKTLVGALSHSDVAALLAIPHQLREKAAECGYRPLIALCGAFDGQAPLVSVLSYEAPFGIGYCTAQFLPGGAAPSALQPHHTETESAPVRLARETLELFIRYGQKPAVDLLALSGELGRRAGVFVSIKKFGELRGCIGTTSPTTQCVAEEIVQNAISAGLHDPRFMPIAADELEHLQISVDILGEAETVQSKSLLDPRKYGVIVTNGRKRGLLLPDLEGVDTIEQQLAIACQKAGIDPQAPYEIARFIVERYR